MHPQEGKTLTPDQRTISDLWDEHMRSEFESHSVEDTLGTMADDPYVNHVPVLTGGVGLDEVRKFYAERFITQQPPGVEIIPVSRTVGNDRVVDELIYGFTQVSRWTGCCPAFPRRGSGSRSLWWSWSSFRKAR
jgi:carboxymethylenebutenolidase